TWSSAGSMSSARYQAAAVVLANGNVLVSGGRSATALSASLTSGDLFDESSNAWTWTGTLAQDREFFTATVLTSGKVLAAGGFTVSSMGYGTHESTTELYDPATGTWSAGGSMSNAR